MYYVTMTDKFMSGWGKAEGKISKFVVECEDHMQAQQIMESARRRDEMKYINYTTTKPRYNANKYVTSYKKFEELGTIWTGK